jgi:hypothetical protein
MARHLPYHVLALAYGCPILNAVLDALHLSLSISAAIMGFEILREKTFPRSFKSASKHVLFLFQQ